MRLLTGGSIVVRGSFVMPRVVGWAELEVSDKDPPSLSEDPLRDSDVPMITVRTMTITIEMREY